MKAGWSVRQIEDVTFIQEGPGIRKYEYQLNGFPMINVRCVQDGYIDMSSARAAKKELASYKWKHFQCNEGDILFTISGTIGRCAIVQSYDLPLLMNTSVVRFRSTDANLENRYLYYFLQSDGFQKPLDGLSSGTAIKNVGPTHIKTLSIPLPPIYEQMRIVAILDEAFAGLDAMRANAEKNLQNARDLFDSYLNAVFSEKGDGWPSKRIGEIAKIKGGKRVPKGYKLLSEKTPFTYLRVTDFSDSGSISQSDLRYVDETVYRGISRYVINSDNLYISIAGTIGKTGMVPPELDGSLLTENACRLILDAEVKPKFIFYFTKSVQFRLQVAAATRTAAQPKLALERLSEIQLCVPSPAKQAEIISACDALIEQSDSLREIYEAKLILLAELKQSILQRAFAGELTSNEVLAVDALEALPASLDTATPIFTAQVLAFSYHWHAAQQRDKTFGRVKAQKTLHLTESVAGIDLGRQPIKDAAGPNDSAHMRRAEDWAKAQGFFEFVVRDDGGYNFKKLANYDALIGAANEAIKPYKDQIQRVLKIVIPLNSQDAEVLATVHAAWNNLILDGQPINDQAIIRAAREDWHASKKQISELKFGEAIRSIRNHGIVPDGTAKRVGGQERLI
jgi:restriction endonuclease S subunit